MIKIGRSRLFLTIFLFFISLLLLVFFYRLLSDREIDDVTLGIGCTQDLLDKSDILWVIPIYENESIASDRAWCDYIISLNKTLGMHGVYHTYREFGEFREEEYVYAGMEEFEKCFGYRPIMFKPPQMYYNYENDLVLNKLGLDRRGKISQVFHKIYHCSDTGVLSNKFMDLF